MAGDRAQGVVVALTQITLESFWGIAWGQSSGVVGALVTLVLESSWQSSYGWQAARVVVSAQDRALVRTGAPCVVLHGTKNTPCRYWHGVFFVSLCLLLVLLHSRSGWVCSLQNVLQRPSVSVAVIVRPPKGGFVFLQEDQGIVQVALPSLGSADPAVIVALADGLCHVFSGNVLSLAETYCHDLLVVCTHFLSLSARIRSLRAGRGVG